MLSIPGKKCSIAITMDIAEASHHQTLGSFARIVLTTNQINNFVLLRPRILVLKVSERDLEVGSIFQHGFTSAIRVITFETTLEAK